MCFPCTPVAGHSCIGVALTSLWLRCCFGIAMNGGAQRHEAEAGNITNGRAEPCNPQHGERTGGTECAESLASCRKRGARKCSRVPLLDPVKVGGERRNKEDHAWCAESRDPPCICVTCLASLFSVLWSLGFCSTVASRGRRFGFAVCAVRPRCLKVQRKKGENKPINF